MNKRKRFFASILACVLLLLLFVGCSSSNIFRMFDSHAKEIVRTEYMNENRVKGIWDNTEEQNQSLPENRTVIIRDTETLDTVFASFPEEVDFSEETVVLYMFTDSSPRDYTVTSARIEEKTLFLECTLEKIFHPVPDATMPYQRCFYIIVKRTDFESVILDIV